MKVKIKPVEIKFNAYFLISNAVSSGIEWGYRRAFKHLAEGQYPTQELLTYEIESAVMSEIGEIISDWGDDNFLSEDCLEDRVPLTGILNIKSLKKEKKKRGKNEDRNKSKR